MEEENKEMVMYGYRNEDNQLLWTSNLEFAKIRAVRFETYGIIEEKTKL